ncbi:hypothetical protein Y032_0036g3302 [Ancylostoma ceylanicum]|uniref:Uncharacterized protein n=1 Tax=Ancylostoma ceylanicum TaxID=53326 RepID=A0A016ULH5_9BILA|nr:hypothetical protein Y032_0036g3302 [Ancylostoma ceylanicum]
MLKVHVTSALGELAPLYGLYARLVHTPPLRRTRVRDDVLNWLDKSEFRWMCARLKCAVLIVDGVSWSCTQFCVLSLDVLVLLCFLCGFFLLVKNQSLDGELHLLGDLVAHCGISSST